MKRNCLLILLLSFAQLVASQIVNVPDAQFKTLLTSSTIADLNGDGVFDSVVDVNNDGEIQISEAEAVLGLNLNGAYLGSIEGIQSFTNLRFLDCTLNTLGDIDFSQNTGLEVLRCGYAAISNLDLSQNVNLRELVCFNNGFTSLDLSQNSNLEILDCSYNAITDLDVSLMQNLTQLICNDNQLQELDVSQNYNLDILQCQGNLLQTLNIKNGSVLSNLSFGINDLAFVCVDDEELIAVQAQVEAEDFINCTVNSYCSFSPGGVTYTLSGTNVLDIDNNGCDAQTDPLFPNLQLQVSNDEMSGTFIANSTGNYELNLNEGIHTITPVVENPNYFVANPSSIIIDFPSEAPYALDFCIETVGNFNDLEVMIVPETEARPGFDAYYKIVYKNKGTTALSGTLEFNYPQDYMSLLFAIPSETLQNLGYLEWNFTNLLPFESREVSLSFNLNTPTDPVFPLLAGDLLGFMATVDSGVVDETPGDNTMSLRQEVVNSYDPNDKTCLEGDVIAPEKVGDFVHYLIRFENTGTASAVNIVVRDDIDPAYYDIDTLVPLESSHDFVTNIGADNRVEFIFENINLPFDDANNDGYVLFKIKTLSSLGLDDTFMNKAEIYFDFNAPIITNEAETTVALLNMASYEDDLNFNLYPNPANDILHIKSKIIIEKIELYDINGRSVKTVTYLDSQIYDVALDVKDIGVGLYLVKITSDEGSYNTKFMRN